MSTWANLVRGWVGYTPDTTPIEGNTELDREEIADAWLMVDDTNAPATLIDVTNEELPSPELLRRRKIWKRRMEKAKSTGQSPSPVPPRAKVLRKSGSTAPYCTKKPAERTKTKRKTSVKTTTTPIENNDDNNKNEVTSDVLPSSSTTSSQVSNLDKKSYVQAAYRGHANNHCRVSNFSRLKQHNKQIQQPSKKN